MTSEEIQAQSAWQRATEMYRGTDPDTLFAVSLSVFQSISPPPCITDFSVVPCLQLSCCQTERFSSNRELILWHPLLMHLQWFPAVFKPNQFSRLSMIHPDLLSESILYYISISQFLMHPALLVYLRGSKVGCSPSCLLWLGVSGQTAPWLAPHTAYGFQAL